MSKKLQFKCLDVRASLFLKKMYHKNESFSYVMWLRNANKRFARFVRFAGWWIKFVGSDPNEDMVRQKIISFTLNGEFFIQRYPTFFVQHFVPFLPSALDPLLSLIFLAPVSLWTGCFNRDKYVVCISDQSCIVKKVRAN